MLIYLIERYSPLAIFILGCALGVFWIPPLPDYAYVAVGGTLVVATTITAAVIPLMRSDRIKLLFKMEQFKLISEYVQHSILFSALLMVTPWIVSHEFILMGALLSAVANYYRVLFVFCKMLRLQVPIS